MVQNKSFIFKKVPRGVPIAGQDIAVETKEFDLDAAPPKGGIVTKILYASLDPYMRGRMRDPSIKGYTPAYVPGSTVQGGMVSKVVKSDNSKFKEGDVISGMCDIAEYASTPEEALGFTRVIQNPWNLPLSYFIGALGATGLTAYSSLYEIGKPKKGETIFISAASGAVGQVVGQIAKHEGLTVIGSVGSDEKLDLITKNLKFDSGFNYKKEKANEALPRLAPQGIDIYYENVGGEQLEAALTNMNQYGRIVACGMVSQYNLPAEEKYGIKNLSEIVGKRITMRGFIVSDPDMGPLHIMNLQKNVGAWIADGSFKPLEHVIEGIDKAADAFIGMLNGENVGKTILKVSAE